MFKTPKQQKTPKKGLQPKSSNLPQKDKFHVYHYITL
jgi:hypothetical protein